MKKIIMIFIVLGFMCSNLHAANITPGNLLISTGNHIYEYTTQGRYVQSFSTQYPGGYPATEYARDIAADTSGNIFVYNGTFYPYMSTFIPGTSSWSHVTLSGFSTVNNGSYGGIAVYGKTVFASDMFTGNGGEAKGVVAFDTATGQAQRFAENTEPIDLTIGLDGLLYTLYPDGSPSGTIIDVYDPSTLSYLRSIDLTAIFGWTEHRTIAVDYNGDIFIADWDGDVHHISKTGQIIATITPTYDDAGSTRTREFNDIDISQNGKIALGTRSGEILLTDTSFSNISSFGVSVEGTFVAFVPVDTTPDEFIFSDQTNVLLNMTITSNTITVSGINTATPISITGGTYSINGRSYISVNDTVHNGDTVTVQLTSPGRFSTTTIATLTIGGVSGTFSVTTLTPYPGSDDIKCFIATAAFGSPLAGQVEILRQFRDRYLLTNARGQKFVAWYYRNGSIAADYIKDRPMVKAAVRVALYPLIGFSLLLISGYLPLVIVGLLLSALLFFRFRPKKLSVN